MAARRYVRDNRGRFASVGATARGGRLATASGNKRATQTERLAGGKPAGTIGRSRKPKPVASPKPAESRQRVRGNFRPQNTMAKPSTRRHQNPFFDDGDREMNAEVAGKYARRMGVKTKAWDSALGSAIGADGSFDKKTGAVSFNPKANAWRDPGMTARFARLTGEASTANPMRTVLHEVGHAKDRHSRDASSWRGPAPASARRVSRYATTNRAEFVAETFAGLRSGQKYDHGVMSDYWRASGRRARSVRSQLKK